MQTNMQQITSSLDQNSILQGSTTQGLNQRIEDLQTIQQQSDTRGNE